MIEEIHYDQQVESSIYGSPNHKLLDDMDSNHSGDEKNNVAIVAPNNVTNGTGNVTIVATTVESVVPAPPPPHTLSAGRALATRQPSVMSDLLEIVRSHAQGTAGGNGQGNTQQADVTSTGSQQHRPNALLFDDVASSDIMTLMQQTNSPIIDQIVNSSLFSSPQISPITSIGGLTALTTANTPTSRLAIQQALAAAAVVPQVPNTSPTAVVSSTTSSGNEELNTPTVIQNKPKLPVVTLASRAATKIDPVTVNASDEVIDVVGNANSPPIVYHPSVKRERLSSPSSSCTPGTPERPFTADHNRSNMSSPYTPAYDQRQMAQQGSSLHVNTRLCQSVEPRNSMSPAQTQPQPSTTRSAASGNKRNASSRKRRMIDVQVKDLPPARTYRVKNENERDNEWRQKRDRNNEAVRKSRMKNKIEQQLLMDENQRLKEELEATKRQLRDVTIQRDHLQTILNAKTDRERAIVSRTVMGGS